MRAILKVSIGLLLGFIVYGMGCWGGRALIRYSEPKLPPYGGPRYYKFTNGTMEIWYPKEDT